MSSFLMMFALAAVGLIIFWYVFDEATRGGEGKSGLLGMVDPAGVGQKDDNRSGRWRRGTSHPWRVRRHRD